MPILLSGYFIFVTDASSSSKSVVAVLLVLSLATLFAVPAHWLWPLPLQVAVGIYVVFLLDVEKTMNNRETKYLPNSRFETDTQNRRAAQAHLLAKRINHI